VQQETTRTTPADTTSADRTIRPFRFEAPEADLVELRISIAGPSPR
jgi:hypothetical protein